MKNKNISLFTTFFKIGAFTFGGGYAMLSLIQKEVVENKKYLNSKDMSDIITIGESTPGPISVNVATFVGYKTNGIIGAFFATLGLILPSILIILLISTMLSNIQENKIFKDAFYGIRIGVVALIIKAFLNMYKECPKDIFSHIIMFLAFITMIFLKISSIYIIITSAIIGILYNIVILRKEKK